MQTPYAPNMLDQNEAAEISLHAARVFTPRVPVSTRDLFAGRWEKLTHLADSVSQPGLHVLIYGERGVGKTSLANIIQPLIHAFDEIEQKGGRTGEDEYERPIIKVNAANGDSFSTVWRRAFDEIWWEEDRPQIGFRVQPETDPVSLCDAFGLPDELSIDHVRRTLSQLKNSVFIFDEYDRVPAATSDTFTDLIKALSDFATQTTTVLVGVADTVEQLIRSHASVSRALTQIHLPRMNNKELADILEKGEKALGMRFDPASKRHIIRMSHGLPHYTHLVAQFAVRAATKDLSRLVTTDHVQRAFAAATQQAHQTVMDRYAKAVHSAHKDSLYSQVLLACAMAAANASDDMGYFQSADVAGPLAEILPERTVQISMYNKHLGEFTEEKRGCVLERTGPKRGYKYRFRDPLVPPYVIMRGIASGLLRQSSWLNGS